MENKNTDLEFNIEEVKEVVATQIMDDDDAMLTVSYSFRRFCC